jgi:hypothetical protein
VISTKETTVEQLALFAGSHLNFTNFPSCPYLELVLASSAYTVSSLQATEPFASDASTATSIIN